MKNIERAIGSAIAGAVAILAVLLLAKPLFEVFADTLKESSLIVSVIVGLILLAIAAGVFQRMTRR